VPVVASRVGAIPELVEHGVAGMLVRANDVSDLEEALETMLRDEAARAAFGERASARVRAEFDLRVNLDRLAAALERELEQFRSAPDRCVAPPMPQPSETVPVMFLINALRTGGEETELGLLARHLDKRRFPMSVMTLWNTSEASPVVSELEAWGIPIDRTCASIDDDGGKVRHIIDRIRRERIGIVVACHDTRIAHRVFESLSAGECRLIEHGGIVSDVANAPKTFTARYIGVSREIVSAAAARMRHPDHAAYIPSMVDVDLYDAPQWAESRALSARWLSETLRACGLPTGACVVIFVGRLDARKRVEDFVQTAREVEADCPDAFFLVVGGADAYQPEYETRLLAEAGDLIARRRLVFAGTRGDVPGLLAASDILVLPSTGEGMAHVINEAGAAGLAVVATADGAAREQLENGRCGVLVEPRNVAQLARAVRALVHDPELRTTLGERLRDRVRTHYAARVAVEQWHVLFSEVMKELSERVRRANGRRPLPRRVRRSGTMCADFEVVATDTSVSV
jgi:glycosyltransferase involved in cell wall biosynthesis